MPSGFFWGGLAQGLGQGFQEGQKLQIQRQELELRRKMIDAQAKMQEFKNKQLMDQADAMTQFQDMMQPSMPAQPAAPLQPGQEGPEPAPGFIAPSTAPSRERLVGTAIRAAGPEHAYNVIDQYLKQGQQPQDLGQQLETLKKYGLIGGDQSGAGGGSNLEAGFTLSPTGITTRLNPKKEGVGVQSQVWSRVVRENPGLPVDALIQKYTQEMSHYQFGTGASGAAGKVAGTAGQTLGEPIQPMQPMQPAQPTQSAQPIQPQPDPGLTSTPTPVPQPGLSPALRAEAGRAGAKKTGTETADMNLPLREKAVNYIEPNGLTTAPPDMTEAQALAKGYRAFTGKNAGQFVTMARSAFGILDRLDTLSKQLLLPESAGVAARAQNWADLQKRYYLGTDPNVKEFFGLLGSQLATFAKAAGDAANIAVPEQEFQKKFLPGAADSQETAAQVIQSRKNLLRGTLEGSLGMKPVPQAQQQSSPNTAQQSGRPNAPVGTVKMLGGKKFQKIGPGETDWEEMKNVGIP